MKFSYSNNILPTALKRLIRDTTEMIHLGRCSRDDFRTDNEVNDYIRKTRTWVTATHRRLADRDMVTRK